MLGDSVYTATQAGDRDNEPNWGIRVLCPDNPRSWTPNFSAMELATESRGFRALIQLLGVQDRSPYRAMNSRSLLLGIGAVRKENLTSEKAWVSESPSGIRMRAESPPRFLSHRGRGRGRGRCWRKNFWSTPQRPNF